MKTYRLTGVALMAILLSVNLSSCSEEEGLKFNSSGVVVNQKHLVQMKRVDRERTRVVDFVYADHRLVSVLASEGVGKDITTYTWGDNIITASRDHVSRTYSLKDKLVRGIVEQGTDWTQEYAFTYDNARRLSVVNDNYLSTSAPEENKALTTTYNWKDGVVGSLTTVENNGNPDVYTYQYSAKACAGYFPLYADFDEDDAIKLVHPELMGVRSSRLPVEFFVKDEDSEETTKYSYTFDKGGYVTSCILDHTSLSLPDSTVYIETDTVYFTWQ